MPYIISNPPIYCEEHHWDSLLEALLREDLLQDEDLTSLLSKEQEYELSAGLAMDAHESRAEAVDWMLRVICHFSFSALTALLAINYFDRFCRAFDSRRGNPCPWMAHLAALGCLSLAAKLEETQVPLLLDLQVEESKYVFESRTIQRMEVVILSTLEWRMNHVTPLSFLDHIARRLGLMSGEFLRRSHNLILSVVSDPRFMCCLPSAMATATMVHVISTLDPCSGVKHQHQLFNILGTHKDKVQECCRLIQEVATSDDFHSSKRKFGSFLDSPRGVMDVCLYAFDDDSNEPYPVSSASASPKPLSKKLKSWAT